jgi:cysteine-rich repeat protein
MRRPTLIRLSLCLGLAACGTNPLAGLDDLDVQSPDVTENDVSLPDVDDDAGSPDITTDVGPDEDVADPPDVDPTDVSEDVSADVTTDVSVDVSADVTTDVSVDVSADVTTDVSVDVSPDVDPPDVGPDVSPDVDPPDVGPDVSPDVDPPDVGPDVSPDVITDVAPDVAADTGPDVAPDTGCDECDPDVFAVECDGVVAVTCELNLAGCFAEQGENCSFRRGGFCSDGIGCEVDLCGDGNIDFDLGERCDDGNFVGGDGCTATCALEEGFVCAGEPSNCEFAECGDGVVAYGEGCEDGNDRDGDGCTAGCFIELPDQGTELLIEGEIPEGGPTWSQPQSCDFDFGTDVPFRAYWFENTTGTPLSLQVRALLNGTTTNGVEATIFDGEWLPGIEPAGCIATGAFPGDISSAVVSPGERIAIIVGPESFGSDGGEVFTLEINSEGCGDGEIQEEIGEVCDDGNDVGTDGCAACAVTEGFTCINEPSICFDSACGDGFISADGDEVCDDGNGIDDDGCTECAIDDGAICFGEPSRCVSPVCGDGTIELFEGCEDGNTEGGDGCSATCQIELGEEPVTTDPVDYDDTADTFLRPNQGAGCGGLGSERRYIARTFFASWDGPRSVTIEASYDGFDGYLHLYESPFNPADSLTNCLNGDDDFGGLGGSQIVQRLEGGREYVVVVSSFSTFADGSFTLDFSF